MNGPRRRNDNGPPIPQQDALDTVKRSHRISLGSLIAIVTQTVIVVMILVQMHADIDKLKNDNMAIQKHIEVIDVNGTRAVVLMQQRLNDSIAINVEQNTRIKVMENTLNEAKRQMADNKFWIDQLRSVVSSYSHYPP